MADVWAHLWLCRKDCNRIEDFFVSVIGLSPLKVVSDIHLTIYKSNVLFPGITKIREDAHVELPAEETRFMVMAPGGEEPNPTIIPSSCKIGIRVHRQSRAIPAIRSYRDRLTKYETPDMLGDRKRSTFAHSAFGSYYYRPHLTLLLPDNDIPHNLTPIGEKFREVMGTFVLNAFTVNVYNNDCPPPSSIPNVFNDLFK